MTQCEGHHKTLHSIVEFSLLIFAQRYFHICCFYFLEK